MEQPLSLSPDLPELLATIKSPDDVKKLAPEQLPQLAQDIRSVLVETVSKNGGHLAPNLGVVELSIALHRVFDSPKDKILFDVSHQSYVHKLLTGRAPLFHTIRQHDGLSGFMKRSESPHDCYGAGHAGTALSAALGICAARDRHHEDFHVVAVAGDAAFTCGTTLEALNNIAQTTNKFIAILNDNEWAIDKNVGALATYFNALQRSETYAWVRQKAENFVTRIGGQPAKEFADKLTSSAKSLIFPSLLFDKFGLRYYGPIDGHNIDLLVKTLEHIKTLDVPVLLHIITQKGRGYDPAIKDPAKFHGLGTFSIDTGRTKPATQLTYSEVFGKTVADLADKDPEIVAVTAAMPTGTKLDLFRDRHPDRLYDVGIAEEHAAIFASGMASQGFKPYVAIYSTFMQRCIDMIQHDAALQHLPVRFCMDRAGLAPDDGPTHHGLFDIAMTRCIPGLVSMQPKDEAEFVNMLYTMNTINDSPSLIRYPRGCGRGVKLPETPELLPIGKAEVISDGHDVVLISLGSLFDIAEEAQKQLEAEGISTALINARFIKPLDADCFRSFAKQARVVITIEDHSIQGGFGSAVIEDLQTAGITTPVERVGWPDQFIEHGTVPLLRQKYGLTAERIISLAKKHLSPQQDK